MIQHSTAHENGQVPRSLDQHFYTDDPVYRREITWLRENMWSLVGHESRIPQPGDYFLYDFDKDSIIVVRDQAGQIRAHHNVCRHRGSRLCTQSTGLVKVFTCPYHAWSYNLDGALRAAPFFPSDFEKDQYGLISCHVRVHHGFIYLSFASVAPDFDEYIGFMDRELELQDAGRAKVAKRLLLSIDANWKVVAENNLECYHCKPAHPTYSAAHAGIPLGRPEEYAREARSQRVSSVLSNSVHEKARQFVPVFPDHSFQVSTRQLIGIDCATESVGGKAVAPLMGQCVYEGAQTMALPSALTQFVLNPDHLVIYSFVPRSVRRTDVEMLWMVAESATEGTDYDIDPLIEVWWATMLEDKVLCEDVQLGIESTAYSPGPLIASEKYLLAFNSWYREHILNGSKPGPRLSDTTTSEAVP